ncbi:hypothetical protein [Amphibacillus cookii]|uniref:YkvI family membrane protein n=1 Tax=Amphibacillus cookii TaxID=767787 RepID=UPI00195C4BC1|nr:hypothetical protein [Amphibacillus cookii]MBM7541351.1 putative membrane protein YkvI [Amphibacillus cookii]
MGKSYQWTFLIMGTMIGAGYASGRELWQFFGPNNGQAIIIFSILFTISCYTIMSISYQQQTNHYMPTLVIIVGERAGWFYDVVTLVYLFSTTIIMVAGSGVTFQAFGIPNWLGITFIVSMILWVFSLSLDDILKMNGILLPILLIALISLFLSFLNTSGLSTPTLTLNMGSWLPAFPFTALNILPLISVLSAIGQKITSKKEIGFASLSSGLLLGGLSYLYYHTLTLIATDINLYEMPLYGILVHFSYVIKVVMTLFLWLAIFTTAVAGMLGLTSRLQSRFPVSQTKLTLYLLLVITPLAFIGFQTLVEHLYPLYGMINLYLLFHLLIYPFKNWYKSRHT